MAFADKGRATIASITITKNEERNIAACLDSLKWVDELIVVDAESADRTVELAKACTPRVFVRAWPGYGPQKNFAMEQATADWVLIVDADERVTDELREEIRAELVRGPRADAFFVPRKNLFLGRWIRHCGWYPDYRQPQFFNKHKLRYRDDLVHEGFEATGTIAYLQGHALQYPFRDMGEYLRKMSRYSSLMAEQMAARGRQFRAHQLVTHPVFTFFKMYGLRQGFRDGMPGLILSLLYAYYTFVKYAKLWERCRTSA